MARRCCFCDFSTLTGAQHSTEAICSKCLKIRMFFATSQERTTKEQDTMTRYIYREAARIRAMRKGLKNDPRV